MGVSMLGGDLIYHVSALPVHAGGQIFTAGHGSAVRVEIFFDVIQRIAAVPADAVAAREPCRNSNQHKGHKANQKPFLHRPFTGR